MTTKTIISLQDNNEGDIGGKRYEAPALLKVGQATQLLQGHVYTANYRDCNTTGTTRYPTGC